jgi:hypothetical protein
MAAITKRRVTAEVDGEVVVFIIGMRINRLWKVHRWLPVLMAMPGMLRELAANPDSGFLGATGWFAWRQPMLVQYWRSFDDLERYARAREGKHFAAWVAFNRRVGSNGDVGIWHETYRVGAGQHESIYNNMPPTGLAKATRTVSAAGYRKTAAGRMAGQEVDEYPPEELAG